MSQSRDRAPLPALPELLQLPLRAVAAHVLRHVYEYDTIEATSFILESSGRVSLEFEDALMALLISPVLRPYGAALLTGLTSWSTWRLEALFGSPVCATEPPSVSGTLPCPLLGQLTARLRTEAIAALPPGAPTGDDVSIRALLELDIAAPLDAWATLEFNAAEVPLPTQPIVQALVQPLLQWTGPLAFFRFDGSFTLPSYHERLALARRRHP